MASTLPEGNGDFKVKDFSVYERRHPDALQLYAHLSPLMPPGSRMNDAQQPRSSPTFLYTVIIQCDPVCKCPRVIQALDLLMVFNNHKPFGALGVS